MCVRAHTRDHLSMQWFTDVGNVLPNEEANGPERAESLSEPDPRPAAEGGGAWRDLDVGINQLIAISCSGAF